MRGNKNLILPSPEKPQRVYIVISIIILILAVGCSASQATSNLPMETRAPAAETAAPTNTATETKQPTFTPTVVDLHPMISKLSDRTITEGENFETINLLDIVTDVNHTPEQITWNFSGNDELYVRQNGKTLSVAPPNFNWAGSETVTLQACNPDNLCDSATLVFTIIEENDLPVINISDQAIQPIGKFYDLILADLVKDLDHPDEELTWKIDGNNNLTIQISEGVVSVTSPDDNWTGSETIRFEVCDPKGGCDFSETQFTVLGPSDVLITYVFNAGFLITTGDQKILLDALNKGLADMGGRAPSTDTLNRLKNAEPPFDNVNLILTTHDDIDHFDAAIVQAHMKSNPEAIFVSTTRTVGKLASFSELQDRLIAIDLENGESTQLTAQGIEIEAVYMDHGEGRPNIGYIFNVGGKKFFHTGDLYVELVDVGYIQDYGIPEKEIDIAFVPIFSLHPDRNHREIFASMQAKQLILMHYFFPYDDANLGLKEEYFPNAIVFHRELETWLVP